MQAALLIAPNKTESVTNSNYEDWWHKFDLQKIFRPVTCNRRVTLEQSQLVSIKSPLLRHILVHFNLR